MKIATALAVCGLLLAACASAPTPAPAQAGGDPAEGGRIADRVGCTGCHQADGRGGGYDYIDPKYGRAVAANLTEVRSRYPDAATLEALLRQGRKPDGDPPFWMPVRMFSYLSDRELRDLFAWLKAQPPLANPGLGQPTRTASLQREIADGSLPFLSDLRPDPQAHPGAAPPAEALALGRHLVMSSCAECHGWALEGQGGAPPLAVAKTYPAEQFTRLLRTGIARTGKETPGGFMSQTARDRFAALTDAEISAIKRYLDSR